MYDFLVDYNSIDKSDFFTLIKQVPIILLSFSISLATKCLSLNDEPCMVRLTLIGFNPV